MTTSKLRAYWQSNPAQAGRCPTCGDFVATNGECINACGQQQGLFSEPAPEPQDINCTFVTGEIEINTNCGSVSK